MVTQTIKIQVSNFTYVGLHNRICKMVYNQILPTFARGALREDKWKCPEREAKGKLVTYGTKKKPH